MAQQYDRTQKIRQARGQEVERFVREVRAGVTQRATFGEGTLSGWTVDRLQDELDGMRRHLRRTLVGTFGRQDGEAVEAKLFEGELDAWKDELAELKIDRLARRAVEIHALVQQGREVVPLIEAARREHWARETAEREAAFAARLAAAKAAGAKLEFGHRDEVRRLIEEHTGEPYYDYGSAASLYGDAARHGVLGEFADVVCAFAAERYGNLWHYAGD